MRRSPKKEINSFLRDALPPLRDALKHLYPPSERGALAKGRRRRDLTYVPIRRGRGLTKEPAGRSFPAPFGDARIEWRYLEGVLSAWAWSDADVFPAKPFPSRDPPFPSARFKGMWISFSNFDKAIPVAAWMLFIDEVPYPLWRPIISLLIVHHVRLSTLAWLRGELETTPRTDKRRRWELKKRWKALEGPPKQYRREASRYLQPLVQDLFNELWWKLTLTLEEKHDEYFSREVRPMWTRLKNSKPRMQPDSESFLQLRVSRAEVYRIVGDLVRFFYPQRVYGPVHQGIDPPEWRGDRMWRIVRGEIPMALVHAGQVSRRKFGKRMQAIYKGSLT